MSDTTTVRYEYFDTPEGEDILKKLWAVLRPVGLSAIGVGTVDVLAYSRPKGYLATIARYGYLSVPIIGASLTFVIVTNLAVNIRKKDDKINWIAGALAAGSVVGAWRKSTPTGFAACAGFTLMAVIKKHCLEQGWTLLPDLPKPSHKMLGSRFDWTLTKERPRNWAVAPPAGTE